MKADKRKSFIKAISGIYRHSQTYLGRRIKKYNIGQGQWAFLTQLLFNYDGITQEELSSILSIDKANTSRALKKLEEQEYIYRKEDSSDTRKKLVYVTDKSRAFEEEFHDIFKDLNRILSKDFTDEERYMVRRLLYKMFDNIIDYGKEENKDS
ncbi:MarR family winged helix-turn-helix transcriptional regulator [Alkalibaculum bacchi]|uniref:MarR family winged helix-turn-helix transcriptional regulator n=1 Tax=Alkalibaculum bacchi TaxID=645887 RepID=UPI0026F35533|nr:MarR family transcriptional regulator [Alkalibaculum bacchi]